MEHFQGPGILPGGLESPCTRGFLQDCSLCGAAERPQHQAVLLGVGSPSRGHGALLRTWTPSWGDKALPGRGVIPEEVESILGRFEFPNPPSSSATLASQASFPEAVSGLSCAGRGVTEHWGWNLRCTQVGSGVSPVKYLLVPCCFFCCQGCGGGEGERDLEEVSRAEGSPAGTSCGSYCLHLWSHGVRLQQLGIGS